MHFASAMTLMLRSLNVPARFVEGYLPGKQMPGTTTYAVSMGARHAWVEVYFPGYGWIRFDPTPGNADNGRVPTKLPPGTPVSAAPTPEASIDAASGTTIAFARADAGSERRGRAPDAAPGPGRDRALRGDGRDRRGDRAGALLPPAPAIPLGR